MTILHIESVKLTASKKNYSVKADGKYYVAALRTGIEQQVGHSIDAVLGSFTSASGQEVSTIEGFTLVEQAKLPISGPSASNGHDRWWVPFVSNQVAHAIQCGLVKELGDIAPWARAAKIAILSADRMEDGDIPF